MDTAFFGLLEKMLSQERGPQTWQGRSAQHGPHGPWGAHGGLPGSQRPEDVVFFLNNGVRLEVQAGDITALEGGAVVAGENNNFTGGGAIAKALLRKGGDKYFEARRRMINEYWDRDPCTDVVLCCPAGDQLPFVFVFHALLTFHTERRVIFMNSFEQLVDIYGHVLDLARRLKINSIVTPLLGSGASGGRLEDCVKAAFVAFSNLKDSLIETITIVEYDQEKAQVIGKQLKDRIERHAFTRHQSPAPPRPSCSPASNTASGHPAPDQKTPDSHSKRGRRPKPAMKLTSPPSTSTSERSTTPPTDMSPKHSQQGKVASKGTSKGESVKKPPRNRTLIQQGQQLEQAGAVNGADETPRATVSTQNVNQPPGFDGKGHTCDLMPDARPRPSMQPQSGVPAKQTSQEQHKGLSPSMQASQEPRPDGDSEEEKQLGELKVHMARPGGVGGGESLPAEGLQSQETRPGLTWTEEGGSLTAEGLQSQETRPGLTRTEEGGSLAAEGLQSQETRPGLTRTEEGGSLTAGPDRARTQHDVTGQMGEEGHLHSSTMEVSEQGPQDILPPDSLQDFSLVGDMTAEFGSSHAPGNLPTGTGMKSGDFWWDFFDLCKVNEEGKSNSAAFLGPNRDMQDYGADNSFQLLSRSEFDGDSSIVILPMPTPSSDIYSFACPSSDSVHQDIPSSEPEDEPKLLPDSEGAKTEPVAESQGPFAAGNSGRDSDSARSSEKDTLQGIVGSMPEGSMACSVKLGTHVPGFEGCGVIVVDYNIPDGIQKSEHPQPGSPYRGCSKRAFLPDNEEGRQVLRLLEEAFDHRLTFQVCEQPGGQALVEWADIPHKTCLRGTRTRGGYPDPDYLATVQTLLRDKYAIE